MVTGPSVVAVSRDGHHRFSKDVVAEVELVAGLGVRGDAHAGATVQHLGRVAADPDQPNLRQVHLLSVELHAEMGAQGSAVGPGELGENVTTRGVDLHGLPRGALLHLGGEAVVEVTGLRDPCAQIDAFRPGLLRAVVRRDADGAVVRRAGIMGVVQRGGVVRAGDGVDVVLPSGTHHTLERV